VQNFKQACALPYTPYRQKRDICGRPGRNDPQPVSTGRRLNVAPTAARKISGFGVFVPSAAGDVSSAEERAGINGK